MGGMDIPAYRIEHRRLGEAAFILAFADDARRPQTALAPRADRLLAVGEAGEVVLVDQATEEVVARRLLLRFPKRRFSPPVEATPCLTRSIAVPNKVRCAWLSAPVLTPSTPGPMVRARSHCADAGGVPSPGS